MSDELKRIGAHMANTMFNLAQRAGDTIDSDLAAKFDKMRKEWDAAVRATPPSPSTAPIAEDERANFEAHLRSEVQKDSGITDCEEYVALLLQRAPNGDYSTTWVHAGWEYWQARAALASKPAAREADTEPLKWESTTPVYTRFITDSRYQKLRPSYQKWYKPICETFSSSAAREAARQSIDTPEFRGLVEAWAATEIYPDLGHEPYATLIAHIDTWGGAAPAAGNVAQLEK